MTCRFTCRITQDGLVEGSGQWVGASRENHPDFAWFPTGLGITNSEVNYDTVSQIVHGEATRGRPRGRADLVRKGKQGLEILGDDGAALIPLSAEQLARLLAANSNSAALRLSLDPAGGAAVGEGFQCSVTSEEPGYLYLFQVDNQGDVQVLFPLRNEDNHLDKGQAAGPIALSWSGPAGPRKIKALVSPQPLALGRLEQPDSAAGGTARRLNWAPSERALVRGLVAGKTRGAPAGLGAAWAKLERPRAGFAVAEATVDVKPAK
jgi:hypothetical protein